MRQVSCLAGRPPRRSRLFPYTTLFRSWVKAAIDLWTAAAGITVGTLFRCVGRTGSTWGDGITEKVIWHVVDRKSTRLNSSHVEISYAVFCLKKRNAALPPDPARPCSRP